MLLLPEAFLATETYCKVDIVELFKKQTDAG